MPLATASPKLLRNLLTALVAGLLAAALLATPAAAGVGVGGYQRPAAQARVGLEGNRAVSPARAVERQKRPQGRTAAVGRTSAAPAPAPAPASVATTPPPTDLSFHGDQISDFALAQSAPGAIIEVPDPAGSGEKVFQMTVSDNDGYPVTPTENPRAEMLSPGVIESGDEFWWSSKFFLPGDFPAATPNFVGVVQGPYGYPWRGSPPFSIQANGGVLKWQRNQTYNWDIPWQIPEIRNQWVDVVIHERFAPDGWIEMWVNGQQITFFGAGSYNPNHVPATTKLAMATMDSSNNEKPNSIYVMNYRKKGMYPSLTVFQGPLSIGATRESVGG
jgi:hypothetical protein